ncbi:hypothetical protein Tco_1438242 [Tanacetum coccineum]
MSKTPQCDERFRHLVGRELMLDILGRTLYWSCHCSLLPPVGVATVALPSPTKPKKGKAALPLKSDRIEAPHMHKAHKRRRALGFRALRLGAPRKGDGF